MSPAEEVVERLAAVYGEPKTPNPELFLVEVTRALTGWDGDVLHRAADRAIAKYRFWPTPAEVLAEARVIAAEKYRANATPAEHKPIDLRNIKGRTPEQRVAAQELVDNMKKVFTASSSTPDEQSVNWRRGQRPEFEAMQRRSRMGYLHMTKDGLAARRDSDDET